MLAINGYSGFIGSALIKALDELGIEYKLFGRRLFCAAELEGVTKILFLSGPSDVDGFKDKVQTATSMVNDYIFNIDYIKNVCRTYNRDLPEIIFGSSIAASEINELEDEHVQYGVYKAMMENYIKAHFENYRIIRIPRVYGKDRKNGLMKFLRERPLESFHNKKINFIDIDDFISILIKVIYSSIQKNDYSPGGTSCLERIVRFYAHESLTPIEIKEKYNL